jgi:hypothetical protein
MRKEEIVVAYDRGRLAVHIPGLGVRRLEGPDAQGVWDSTPGDDRFSFVVDASGKVQALILIERIRSRRTS